VILERRSSRGATVSREACPPPRLGTRGMTVPVGLRRGWLLADSDLKPLTGRLPNRSASESPNRTDGLHDMASGEKVARGASSRSRARTGARDPRRRSCRPRSQGRLLVSPQSLLVTLAPPVRVPGAPSRAGGHGRFPTLRTRSPRCGFPGRRESGSRATAAGNGPGPVGVPSS